MDRLAPDLLEDHLGHVACLHRFRGQLWVRLGDSYDVSHRIVGVRSHDEIRRSKEVEVEQFVFRVGDRLHKLPQFLRCRGNGHPEAKVHRLVGSEVMMPGTDAADAVHNARDFFRGLSLDELLKSSQGHEMHFGVFHVPRIIQVYVDRAVPFDACDGGDIDHLATYYWASFRFLPGRSRPCAPENRKSETYSGRELISIPLDARALSMSRSWLPSCWTGP